MSRRLAALLLALAAAPAGAEITRIGPVRHLGGAPGRLAIAMAIEPVGRSRITRDPCGSGTGAIPCGVTLCTAGELRSAAACCIFIGQNAFADILDHGTGA